MAKTMTPEEREMFRQCVWILAASAFVHGSASAGLSGDVTGREAKKAADKTLSAYDATFPAKESSDA
jgi:hypothetical protein